MRRLLLTAALTMIAFAPTGARAQQEDEAGSENEDIAPEGSSTIAPEKKPATPRPATTGKASAPGTQHTVEKGDTLWDLSQKFLGSPWYWPKVWSYNPEIANPHWIYPGNAVRFYAQGEEVPTQVEVGQPEEIDQGEMIDDGVSVNGQIGFRPKNSVTVSSPGFVTSREVEDSGRIFGSFSEATMLSAPDRIYVQFKKAPRLGEQYVVFRHSGEVIHPVTKDPIGYFTKILAEVKVIRVEKDNKAIVHVVKQYDEIWRGDAVGPSSEPVLRYVVARPNERDVKGAYLVSDVVVWPTTVGEHALAIIDKGSDDGVKLGNTFTFWRQQDPHSQANLMSPTYIEENMPKEDVGTCVAFEVKAKVTVCLVTNSLRELVPGEHAEIRASGNGRRASR